MADTTTPEQRGRDVAAGLFDGTVLTETRLAAAKKLRAQIAGSAAQAQAEREAV